MQNQATNGTSSFRLDRAMSVHVFHPMARLHKSRQERRIPILMYHGIQAPSRNGHPYYETCTSPETFARQMQFLRENGYTAVNLDEAIQRMATGACDRKYVVITFDDGFRDFYTHAFPVLAENGFGATMFVVSGLTGEQPAAHEGREYLSWPELRELRRHGIEIGSHTVSHPKLKLLDEHQIDYEVGCSKQMIEDHLGEAIRAFSYPYAFPEHNHEFTEFLRDLLQAHGYQEGVSTILGTASPDDDWFFLPRLPVNSYDDLRFLQAKLEGGYNWLHPLQYAVKVVKPQSL